MAKRKQLVPHKEPKQDRSSFTYDVILEATAHILSESGYAATTTNHIAERAGISIGSLYQYFPNKEAIIVELLKRHIAEGQDHIMQLFERLLQEKLSVAEMIKIFVEAAIDHQTKLPELHTILEKEVPHPAHIIQASRDNEINYMTMISAWLEESGVCQLPHLNVSVQLVIHTIKTLAHWYIVECREEIKRTVFVEELTAMITRYLFPNLRQ